MKFNQWTLGLAAVGAISLTSAARADDSAPKLSQVNTALSDTTLSGSVSVSGNVALNPTGAAYDSSFGNNSYNPVKIPFQSGKQDGFNLDVVRLTLAKPQDDSPWASGYQVDLMMGPDAVGYNPVSNGSYDGGVGFAIKQAYLALRTPVGNGIDWKIGVFDTVIGYEVTDAGSDPNYTRSFGYALEPTEHTGVLATYKINDMWTVSAGIANTLTPGINTRNTSNNGPSGYWKKTLMGSVAVTAPSNWGWASGSMLYAGVVYGFNSGAYHDSDDASDGQASGFAAGDQFNGYAGATLNTPLKALTLGAAFDYVQNLGGGSGDDNFDYHTDVYVIGLYANYKVTDKLSLNARGEYAHAKNIGQSNYANAESNYGYSYNNDAYELTGTVEYDLWANVISRVEIRWDHLSTPNYGDFNRSTLGLYANLIYKF